MNQYSKISIEELADGKLPKHVIESIGNLKLTLREALEWMSKSRFMVAIKDGHITIDVRQRWSLKKLTAICAATIGLLWAFIKVIVEAWPIIAKWFSTI